MKLKNKILLSFTLLAMLAAPVAAQTVTNPTPPLPGGIQVSNITVPAAPFEFLLNLLPYWDRTLTNSFDTGLSIKASSLWKTASAAGVTPYASLAGDYMFTRNLGLGGEGVLFGNGTGTQTLDSMAAYAILRKDSGNVAGYLLAGVGYDFNQDPLIAKRVSEQIGVGLIFHYKTGVDLFVDTRARIYGTANGGFLTRVGLSFAF